MVEQKPETTSTQKAKQSSTLVTVTITVLLALLVLAGFYIWQEKTIKTTALDAAGNSNLALLSCQAKLAECDPTQIPAESPNTFIVPTSPTEQSCTVCDELPVWVFAPGGLFTDSEKTELENKMINPFFDFENADGTELNFVTMRIQKLDPVPEHGYKYDVEAISKTGVYHGFLFGQNDPLEWWTPECLGGCEFTPAFEAKYPEIVSLLE